MNLMLGSEFAERVYAAVRMIPEGHVATYGDIAALAGSPVSYTHLTLPTKA